MTGMVAGVEHDRTLRVKKPRLLTQVRRWGRRKCLQRARDIRFEGAAGIHQLRMSEPAYLADDGPPLRLTRRHLRIADDVGRLQPILALVVLGHVRSDTVEVDLRVVLPKALRADCEVTAG